jgi:penicillin-binding protein 1A
MGGAVIASLAFVATVAGLAIGTWNAVCRDCPSIAEIYVWEPQSATRILDRDGKLISELFQVRRTPVAIETLPEHVQRAFVAVEDKRFYDHPGFDYRRLMSVTIRNLLMLPNAGGASTITQQLARWMFQDEIGFVRSGAAGIRRKLKEMKVARELEDVYSKDEILEAYINTVNYGEGRHGIEAASQYFFGKPAVELDPAEAAMLAAVINRPTTYSPFRNPDNALARRNRVLRLMVEQGYLAENELAQWQAVALPESPARESEGTIAPYFTEWVRGILQSRYGDDLYSRGFRVTTSLDLEMQKMAQVAMDTGWARIEATPAYRWPKYDEVMAQGGSNNASETSYVQGMFIALDPATGGVRALIGGRDFGDSKFNRAVQALRQPGSTFKPFTYTAAIAAGIPASHVIYDSPLFIEDVAMGTVYSPKNFDPEFRGPLTLRNALRWSVNTVAVRLGQEVGFESVAQMARQLGITTDVPPYPSTAIGAPSVIPLEMAQAYTVFANGGTRVTAQPIVRVEDAAGRVLWEPVAEREEALDPLVASIVRDMLRTALDHGTGGGTRNFLPREVPAGGKTGTTNESTNVWFIGFTPDLLGAVWFGFDRPKRIIGNATGGLFGTPVWGLFMRSVYYGDDAQLEIPQPWPWPEGITSRVVDRMTGRLANRWCPDSTYVEYFISGTEPSEACEPPMGRGLFGTPLRMRRDTTDTTGAVRLRAPPILPRRDTIRH